MTAYIMQILPCLIEEQIPGVGYIGKKKINDLSDPLTSSNFKRRNLQPGRKVKTGIAV